MVNNHFEINEHHISNWRVNIKSVQINNPDNSIEYCQIRSPKTSFIETLGLETSE